MFHREERASGKFAQTIPPLPTVEARFLFA
jgi:hypothetical protein